MKQLLLIRSRDWTLGPILLSVLFLIGCSTPSRLPQTAPAAADLTAPINSSEAIIEPLKTKRTHYFNWPVDQAVLTRGFLPNKRRPHLGVDLAAPKGTPIVASHDGSVIYAGKEFKGFGKMVLIEGERGWATLYAHLSEINTRTGDKIRQGEAVGKMGRTGRASGVHLHFEIRQARGPVDPLLFLPGGQIAIQQAASNDHN